MMACSMRLFYITSDQLGLKPEPRRQMAAFLLPKNKKMKGPDKNIRQR
jgi:hypothetical protein